MRLHLNQPIHPPKNVTPRKKVVSEKKMVKKSHTPSMDEAQIRTKIAKQKERMANPKLKALVEDKSKLKSVLKNSNFSFSARERKVFAKILGES